MTDGAARFELREVVRYYPRRDSRRDAVIALNGATLELPEQMVTALVGPSGAGKSTLARVLLRIEKQDSGELFYRGRPLETCALAEFRRDNQILFQNPCLAVNPSFTVARIVCEPLRIAGCGRIDAQRRAAEMLAAMELPAGLAERYPAELSAGQLQRVALARALVLEPAFLALDEPFSCLDEIAAARLLKLLALLQRERGLGMLLICHNPRHAAVLARRTAVMEAGRIVNVRDT